MKNSLGIFVAAAAMCALASPMQAQTVSLQYQTNGSPVIGSGTAGAVPLTNWNVAPLPYVVSGTTTLSNLVSSSGTATTISESTYSEGGYDSGTGEGFANGSSNYNLFRGYALGNFGGFTDITLSLSGLVSADTYSLLTYVSDSDTGGTILSGSINVAGSTTYYLQAASSLGAFTRGTATTSGSAAPGDYFEFDGITGVNGLTFTLPAAGGLTELYGFQLIDTTPVPEPSTSVAILGGFGILIGFKIRRKLRKSPAVI